MANESVQESLQWISLAPECLENQSMRHHLWSYYADRRIARVHRERSFQEIRLEPCCPERVQIADSEGCRLSSSDSEAETRASADPLRAMRSGSLFSRDSVRALLSRESSNSRFRRLPVIFVRLRSRDTSFR